MPQCTSPKDELYCRLRAKGYTQIDAYVGAGFRFNRTSASQYEKKPHIKARIAELVDKKMDERNINLDAPSITMESFEDIGLTRSFILKEMIQVHLLAKEAQQFKVSLAVLELLGNEVDLFLPKAKALPDSRSALPKASAPSNILKQIAEAPQEVFDLLEAEDVSLDPIEA